MQSKRGQLSLFIAIGIVLVLLIGILIVSLRFQASSTTEIQKVTEKPMDIVPIQNYVESCIESVGKDAVLYIGGHGGYYELPVQSSPGITNKVPYYFYINHDLMPTLDMIEQQLSNYMNNELFFCLQNFNDFRESGMNISQGKIVTQTTILPGSVLFEVNMPLVISKDSSHTILTLFSRELQGVRLYTMYTITRSLLDEQLKDSSKICIGCIIDLAEAQDMYTSMQVLDTTTVIFTITDLNTTLNDFPLVFSFANIYGDYSCTNPPYDWSEDDLQQFMKDCVNQQMQSTDYTLKLEDIPDLDATINEPFAYQVQAMGINLVYSDYTDLFDINDTTGEFNFTPTKDNLGDNYIWLSVKDSIGNEKYTSFMLTVHE